MITRDVDSGCDRLLGSIRVRGKISLSPGAGGDAEIGGWSHWTLRHQAVGKRRYPLCVAGAVRGQLFGSRGHPLAGPRTVKRRNPRGCQTLLLDSEGDKAGTSRGLGEANEVMR